jgi:hypothetical protein
MRDPRAYGPTPSFSHEDARRCEALRDKKLWHDPIPCGTLIEMKTGVRLFVTWCGTVNGTEHYGLHWENNILAEPRTYCQRHHIRPVEA